MEKNGTHRRCRAFRSIFLIAWADMVGNKNISCILPFLFSHLWSQPLHSPYSFADIYIWSVQRMHITSFGQSSNHSRYSAITLITLSILGECWINYFPVLSLNSYFREIPTLLRKVGECLCPIPWFILDRSINLILANPLGSCTPWRYKQMRMRMNHHLDIIPLNTAT